MADQVQRLAGGAEEPRHGEHAVARRVGVQRALARFGCAQPVEVGQQRCVGQRLHLLGEQGEALGHRAQREPFAQQPQGEAAQAVTDPLAARTGGCHRHPEPGEPGRGLGGGLHAGRPAVAAQHLPDHLAVAVQRLPGAAERRLQLGPAGAGEQAGGAAEGDELGLGVGQGVDGRVVGAGGGSALLAPAGAAGGGAGDQRGEGGRQVPARTGRESGGGGRVGAGEPQQRLAPRLAADVRGQAVFQDAQPRSGHPLGEAAQHVQGLVVHLGDAEQVDQDGQRLRVVGRGRLPEAVARLEVAGPEQAGLGAAQGGGPHQPAFGRVALGGTRREAAHQQAEHVHPAGVR